MSTRYAYTDPHGDTLSLGDGDTGELDLYAYEGDYSTLIELTPEGAAGLGEALLAWAREQEGVTPPTSVPDAADSVLSALDRIIDRLDVVMANTTRPGRVIRSFGGDTIHIRKREAQQ